jgi:primosomal protein N' (replication factor Y)
MNNPRPCYLQIAIDTPLNAVFDYRWTCDGDQRPQVGQLALVSFARREVVGLIVGVADDTDVPVDKLKDALAVRSQLSPLSAKWLALAGLPPITTSARWAKWRCPACPRTCAC